MSEDFNENDKIKSQLQEILKTLTAREVKVLRDKFGIQFDNSQNLEEIGKQFLVARERIRKIEQKALRKLRKRDDDDDPCPA